MSCTLDPIPTSHLRQRRNYLVPLITAVISVSKQSEQAVVIPLLEKPGLGANDLKHFRVVSNLPFILKILEKVVLKQLQKHLSDKSLLEVHQSAHGKDHSAETAVLRVLDCLFVKADEKLVFLSALLDLSAAFDTFDHIDMSLKI